MSRPVIDLNGPKGRIVDAALALATERPWRAISLRDIAERVGINIATLHYHVPSKEALVELLASSMRDEFIAQQERRPREGLSSLEMLRGEFADFRETELENPELHQVMVELAERAGRDKKVAAVIRPMQAYWREQVVAVLRQGRDDGSFRPDIDPEAAASMVIGAMISSRKSNDDIQFFDRVTAELERALVCRDTQGKQS